ncbi:unnamed protein product [Caenorhabditis sp. 36 PRJEB53466]|nr:unnamed protein product [Caenorhabditis sp. 36 PRJEB53466]
MPLLHKRLFEPNPVPEGVTSSTRIFFCKPTKEVFLTHTDFFSRMILLNSTAWSCSLTRKTNLTFYEAMSSEGEAERELGGFPEYLEVPILFIVHRYTNRGRFEELVNDIYYIMKERYFNNEEVVFSERSKKYLARIVASFTPFDGQNGHQIPSGSEIRDPVLPPPDSFTYTVEIIDNQVPLGERFRERVSYEKLFRPKNVGARQKVRLFLKTACHMPLTGERYVVREEHLEKLGHIAWGDVMAGAEPICPQTPALQRGRIPNTLKPGYVDPPEKKERKAKEKKDSSVPTRPRGRPPKTPQQKAIDDEEKKVRKRKSTATEHAEFDLTSSGAMTLTVASTSTPVKKKKKRQNSMSKSEKKKTKILEQQGDLNFYFSEARRLGINLGGLEQEEKLLSPKVVAEFKQKVKEEKDAERELIKEEKKRKLREKAAYMKKRDDLLCDDLKPMPRFPKLEIPAWMKDDEFGEYMFVLQFFCTFKDVLPLKEIRGNDEVRFSDIVLAIKCNDPQNSPFADLMRVLLSIRTDIADEEDGDEADFTNREEVYLINTQNCDPANAMYGDAIRECNELHWKIRKTHGKSARHLPVDWMTLTEVIRLVLETSGYYTGIATHRHRLYARGNYRGYEDPAFELKMSRPDIMSKLLTQTVFDLEPSERLEIIRVFIYQLLSYSKFRTYIEEKQGELAELKREQKKLKAWDVGQEGDANAARLLLGFSPKSPLNGSPSKEKSGIVKRLKTHIKAHNEGRRLDKDDLESILLNFVPFTSLSLDEIVTARQLQKAAFQEIFAELVSKIFTLHCNISNLGLGWDRAFRKYIVNENLSAILIENPSSSSDSLGICSVASAIESDELLQESSTQEVFLCSGELETCVVHGPSRLNRTRWCYVENREQFEQLAKSMNPRGIRESELLEELNEYRAGLLHLLEETENSRSEEDWKRQWMTDENDPADTYNIDWDTEMRDLLLDFEEKIEQGQMGSIEKTFSFGRTAWRENLKNQGDVCMLLQTDIRIGNELAIDLENAKNYSDVKKLAIAFFLIIKSISFKFIKTPFISPNKDEHGNSKPSELYVRWQKALLQCQSLSALSLFISTLESSIKWDKSRLQGKCRSCRRKAAAHELVLCSDCDSCYHLKCVKLSIETNAPTDWLCSTCLAQKRKEENEAKRLKRVDKMGEGDEEAAMNNLSIESDNEFLAQEAGSSSSSPSVQTIRTASGRSVRKVQYHAVHEGINPKARKSNGSLIMSPLATPSERPVRSTAIRTFDLNEKNGLSDDDEDQYEASSRQKKTVAKKSVANPNATVTEAVRIAAQSTKEKMSAIESLLKKAMREECSWPFLQPVDSKEVPDYYDVIKRPMDLRTMMNKIKQRIYNQPVEVRNDFRLILSNCEIYNETESEIYQLSRQLYEFVASRLDAIIDQ